MIDKYRPVNNMEGGIFIDNWCLNCLNETDKLPCRILTCAFVFDINDESYPEEWTYNDNGSPICTEFIAG